MSMHSYAPRELTQLPFNLYRSQIFPPNPPLFQQAVDDQLAGRRGAAFLPKKMLFTKWKDPQMQWSSSVTSVLDASDVYEDKVNAMASPIAEGKGVYTPQDAARALNRLPQPRDDWQFDPNPIARGMYNFPITQGSSLSAYARFAANPQSFDAPVLDKYTPLQAALPDGQLPSMASLGRALRGLGRAGCGLGRLGAAADATMPALSTETVARPTTATTVATLNNNAPKQDMVLQTAWALLGFAGLGLGLYHGWHRTHKTGWTVGWGIAGAVLPVFTIPLILVQGVGKK